ncbi:MAG: glycosyltransferase [Xanthomarina gelatinilytica]|uniref:glycosyltransferase n=1 Tax=Xanthomarina gelatinilytica TaxID=1137281 RepID=UPI003A89F576
MSELWILYCLSLGAYYFISIILVIVNFKKIQLSKFTGRKEKISFQRIYIIPLLNEKDRFQNLINQFSKILEKESKSKLVLVTTEREFINSRRENSTVNLIENYLSNSPLKNRILHLHYPKINNVVAKQLNYATDYFKDGLSNPYFIFYNADSVLSEDINTVLNSNLDGFIYQQSSLFTNNLNTLLNQGKFLTSTFAVYQSIWTIRVEITRLRLNNIPLKWFYKIIKLPVLTHCITHGLCIPKNELQRLKGFPDLREGGEDVALGYLACLEGKKIHFLPTLENSDSPKHLKSYLKQMKFWFIALFFCFRYNYKGFKNRVSFGRYQLLKSQAIFAIIRKLVSGPILIGYLIIGALVNKFLISLLFIILAQSLLFLIFAHYYQTLDLEFFRRIELKHKLIIGLLLPLTPIFRSIMAFTGMFTYFKLKDSDDFLKPRTD